MNREATAPRRLIVLALVVVSCRKSEPAASNALWSDEQPLASLCKGGDEARHDGKLWVQTWRSPDVSPEPLLEQTRHAAAYYQRLGLNLGGGPSTNNVAAPYAFEDLALVPSIAAILASPAAGEDARIILLPDLPSPRSRLRGHLPELSGLTLTAASAATLNIPKPVVPTILLSARELSLLPDGIREYTLAHELGHVLGYGHPQGQVPHLLMSSTRRRDCVPRLVPQP